VTKLIILHPVSRIAQRLTDGEPVTTVAGDMLLPDGQRTGPVCPICGIVMVTVTGDPHLIACPNSQCAYWNAPFRSATPVMEVHNAPVADPV